MNRGKSLHDSGTGAVTSPLRTLIVDDNPDFLSSLRWFLRCCPSVEVVGTAHSGGEAVEQVALLHPDLVLLDLVMPGMSGLDALRLIKARPAAPRVILLTLQDEAVFRAVAEECGADGYVNKMEMGERLEKTILELCPVDPEVGRSAVGTAAAPRSPLAPEPGDGAPALGAAESIFETAREPLLLLDEVLRVRLANRAFYDTFRVSPEETDGRPLFALGNGQWDIPRLRLLLEDVIPRGVHVSDFEVEHEFPHIGRKSMVLNARRICHRVGARVFLAIEDVTEKKQAREEARRLREELEERVRQRTAELEAANRELEAFSYSVSHDLRSPLRALDGFTRILLEEHAAALPAEAQGYVRDLRRNAQKMGQLVDDLLAFSRLGRQSLQKRPVDPAALVRQALDELRPEDGARRVEVVVGELPTCSADPSLLKQVWVNLLSNALKYTTRHDPSRIEVGSYERAGERVYFVRDTGAGFDMRYAGKLFGVFQRLHKAADYEGTGVGLAIVQRVVHRHGGRVWAEAAVNKGATFYFTVPPSEDRT